MPAETQQPSNKPEKTFGPFAHGLGVTIWCNVVETKEGPKAIRSITIDPRRYKDDQGQWKDSTSYHVIDLPTITMALEKAYDYCQSTPLPNLSDIDPDTRDAF